MKLSPLRLRWVVALFLALGLRALPFAVAAEPVASLAVPPPGELMRTAYLALVRDSIVPAKPRVIASAAIEVLAKSAPEHRVSLPASFGADPERDADWLAERVEDLPPQWSVMEAMARAAETAHVGFVTPQRRQGIGALGSGRPLSSPGFNLYPLPDGRRVVFDLIAGGSAQASGLRVGDVLLRIDGRRTVAVDPFLLTTLPAGTELVLDLERANRPETLTLRLIKTEVSPVESRLLDDGIGYVFIRWFAQSTDSDRDTAALACRAIASLAGQGARGLILDLRSSLGGAGEVKIASALCDGEVIYSTRKPLSAPVRPVKRQGERTWPDRPIVVLVNQQTVSAPEALALSLRELAHARIIGQPTAGGLTEFSIVPLAAGHGMTIPTGLVLGPVSGATLPPYTVKPDLEVANPGIDDLLRGRDGQLDAARAALSRSP